MGALLLMMGAGCGSSPTERVLRLELLPRPSCGASTRTFDTTCVKSFQIRVLDSSGAVLDSQCTTLTTPFGTVHEFISLRDIMQVLQNVPERRGVKLEMRAYHALGTTPCTDLSESQLMFWGISNTIDLIPAEQFPSEIVEMPFECRPGCDCADFDNKPDLCSSELSSGICAPLPNFLCRRTCENDETCPERLTCNIQENQCAPQMREPCAVCTGPDDCISGLCVQNLKTNEKFCAVACPPTGRSALCGLPTSCAPLNRGVFELIK